MATIRQRRQRWRKVQSATGERADSTFATYVHVMSSLSQRDVGALILNSSCTDLFVLAPTMAFRIKCVAGFSSSKTQSNVRNLLGVGASGPG